MSKRRWLLLGSAVPVLALIALLAWASLQSSDKPGVIDEPRTVSVEPNQARDFSLELLDGSAVVLADLRGNVVMLDFWASWCAPCREEAPALAQVYGEYQDSGVEFIGVAIWDNPQDARDFVEQFEVPYPAGVDTDGTIAIDYGVKGIPEKIFVDADGVVSRKFVGPIDIDTLRTTLDGLLEGVDPSS